VVAAFVNRCWPEREREGEGGREKGGGGGGDDARMKRSWGGRLDRFVTATLADSYIVVVVWILLQVSVAVLLVRASVGLRVRVCVRRVCAPVSDAVPLGLGQLRAVSVATLSFFLSSSPLSSGLRLRAQLHRYNAAPAPAAPTVTA
jgi:hypothetical protein